MKHTNLSSTLVSRLRENIAGPGGLHHLDLSNANAGPKELTSITDCIKYNSQNIEGVVPLISIDLSGNHICGVDFMMTGTCDNTGIQDFVTVLNNIGSKSRLRKINLSRNYLDICGFISLSNLVSAGPQSLSELCLRDCGANDEAVIKLMDALKQAKGLQVLDLSHNRIGIDGCDAIGEMLTLNAKLRQINLSECDIGPGGAVAIARGFHTNTGVEALLLGDNGIGNEGAEAIAHMLKVNNRLKHLDLQENGIGVQGTEEISDALKINRTLVFLGLQWNELTNEAAVSLSEALSTNNVLRSVHILGTQIDAEGVKKLMDSSIQLGDKKLDVDVAFTMGR